MLAAVIVYIPCYAYLGRVFLTSISSEPEYCGLFSSVTCSASVTVDHYDYKPPHTCPASQPYKMGYEPMLTFISNVELPINPKCSWHYWQIILAAIPPSQPNSILSIKARNKSRNN